MVFSDLVNGPIVSVVSRQSEDEEADAEEKWAGPVSDATSPPLKTPWEVCQTHKQTQERPHNVALV